jgi:hypothetical protein
MPEGYCPRLRLRGRLNGRSELSGRSLLPGFKETLEI